MKSYQITFTIDDHRYTEAITATSSSDARRLIQTRPPRYIIWNLRAV